MIQCVACRRTWEPLSWTEPLLAFCYCWTGQQTPCGESVCVIVQSVNDKEENEGMAGKRWKEEREKMAQAVKDFILLNTIIEVQSTSDYAALSTILLRVSVATSSITLIISMKPVLSLLKRPKNTRTFFYPFSHPFFFFFFFTFSPPSSNTQETHKHTLCPNPHGNPKWSVCVRMCVCSECSSTQGKGCV